jgi:hypothetical protein
LGLPIPGLSFFKASSLLVVLAAGFDEAAQGLLLVLKRLCMPDYGLSRTIQFLNGVPDLLVAQDTSSGEV